MATGGEISGVDKPEAGAVPGFIDKKQKQLSDIAHESVDETHQSDIGNESIDGEEKLDVGAKSIENHRQSDAVHDYTCSPCSKNDVKTDATHYCPECDVCYCKACLCDHVVIGRSKVEQWGKAAIEGARNHQQNDEQQIKCLRHQAYTVTLYCVEHDVLCCQLCNATEHSLCKYVQKLSTAAETDDITDSVANMEDEIMCLQTNTETLKKNREMMGLFVESSYTNYMKQLVEMQEDVNAKFDAVKEDARVQKRNLIDRFSTDKHICTNIAETLKGFTQTLKNTEDKQKRFVQVKWAKEWVGSTLKETFAKVFQNIPRVEEVKALEGLTKAIYVKMAELKFSIETKEDKEEVELVGICQIANENFVVADKANKCLKQLDNTYTVVSRYNLQDSPLGICATGDSEVAVAMDNKKIFVVSVGTSFETVRTLEFDHTCSCVAYHNEQVFICTTRPCSHVSYNNKKCRCQTTIKIYDKAGNALRQMTADIGEHVCSYNDNGTPICISEDGMKIYVAHRSGLAVLDSEGQRIISSQEYKSIVGLCVDSKGALYASMSETSGVLKFSQEGTGGFCKIKTEASSLEKTTTPGVICYDKRLGRIVICQWKSRYINLEEHTLLYKKEF